MSSTIGGEGGTGPADNRPLTDTEYQLLQRLLSDPLSFPLSFKAWLVSYLETSDMTLPMNAILGLQKTLGISGAGSGTLGVFPAGLILPYGGTAAPTGSLMCDGAAYPRTTQARLFNAIGTNYGAPDANSFYVPNMQGRLPVGRGPNSEVAALGQNEGAPIGNRTPRHSTTLIASADGSVGASGDGNIVVTDHSPGVHVIPNHDLGTSRPSDTPAFLVVNFIIVS